jgi:hypothetical protein
MPVCDLVELDVDLQIDVKWWYREENKQYTIELEVDQICRISSRLIYYQLNSSPSQDLIQVPGEQSIQYIVAW